jgi:hypothetical protein
VDYRIKGQRPCLGIIGAIAAVSMPAKKRGMKFKTSPQKPAPYLIRGREGAKERKESFEMGAQ